MNINKLLFAASRRDMAAWGPYVAHVMWLSFPYIEKKKQVNSHALLHSQDLADYRIITIPNLIYVYVIMYMYKTMQMTGVNSLLFYTLYVYNQTSSMNQADVTFFFISVKSLILRNITCVCWCIFVFNLNSKNITEWG